MKIKKSLFFLLFFLFFLSKSYAKDIIKVVAGIYEPFVYYENGRLVGFDVDLLDKICERNNLRYSIDIVSFQEVIRRVSNGEADVGIGAIYVTDERKLKFDFTYPYLKTGLVFVTNVDFKGNINDLKDKKIGVKFGATGEKLALEMCKNFVNCKVVGFDSTEDSLVALVNKNVDLVLNDYINTNIMMVRQFRGKIYMPKGIFDIPKLVTKDVIAFPVNKQKKELLEKFNKTIKELDREGYINELLKFWPEIKPYPNIEKIMLINFSFFVLLLFVVVGIFKYSHYRRICKIAVENEQKIKSVLDSSPNVIIICDEKGEIFYVNKTFSKIFDDDLTKIRDIFNFYGMVVATHEELKKIVDAYNNLLNNKDKINIFDQNLVDKENRKRICDIQGTYIGQFNNQKLFLTIIKDETYIKELEQKFYQSQKLESIGRLAGGIAHDFNNFLTAVNGFIYLSLMDLDNKEEVRKNLEKILDSAQKAENLTKQLLAFSRKQFIKPVVHNLNKNIVDLQKIINKIVGEDIEVKIELEPELGNVKIDPSQVDQLLMNLVVNARDAMPKGGMLRIATKNVFLDSEYISRHPGVIAGEYIMLTVEDTGVGMTDEVKAHLFEPFFTTKEKGKGTGLGLATVYGIVKQNNGYIWVYSELGIGTTFKIYFPRIYEDIKHEEIRPIVSYEKLSGKILVVEDEGMVREFIKNTLIQYGYKVLEAKDGFEGLELFRTNSDIDLILTDIVMPKMSGIELAEKIKEIRPDIRILLMSGYSEELLAEKKEFTKNYALIEKPFTALKLIETIKKLL